MLQTEDDTFKVLRRASFQEMRNLVIEKNNTDIPEERYQEVMADLLASQNWTSDEYDRALEQWWRTHPY